MVLADGQPVEAATFNNEFVSKVTDSTVTSVIELDAPSSGGNIPDLQQAVNDKQDEITGGASSITDTDLDPSVALVSDPSGKVASSAVTATELGYLSGATSNIQDQIDAVGGVELQFDIENNQSSPADVTGLIFDSSEFIYAKVDIVIHRTDATPTRKFSKVTLDCTFETTDGWDIEYEFLRDDPGVVF
jgi:hypothetical protein